MNTATGDMGGTESGGAPIQDSGGSSAGGTGGEPAAQAGDTASPDAGGAGAPAMPPPGADIQAGLAIARNTTCWLREDGAVYCWGDNNWEQFGAGPVNDGLEMPYPHAAPVLTQFQGLHSIGLSRWASYGVDGMQQLWGAGRGGQGALPNEVQAARQTDVPVLIDSDSTPPNITQYAASYHAGCAVSGGNLYCTGRNMRGEVGDGTTMNRDGFVDIGVSDVTDITGGYYHLCAISAGKVFCWGGNEWGQMGDGGQDAGKDDALAPIEITLPEDAVQIAGGSRHTCAVMASGQVYCWGGNWNRMAGNCGATCTPTLVDGVSGVVHVATSSSATCALLGDETVTCWGENYPVGDLTNVKALESGHESNHFCALVDDGGDFLTPYCWGDFAVGQLGRGTFSPEDPETPASIMLP